VTLADGLVVQLREPKLTMADLAYGPLHPQVQMSARIAPPMIGLGLLAAIPAEDLLHQEDPDDRDGDGISGRARLVGSGHTLGRYGWKAATATLEEQIADAFAMDMGLSSRLRPRPHGDCTARQADCLGAPTGESESLDGHELSDEMIGVVAAYLNSLPARPRPAGDSPGFALFASAGCGTCHQPSLPDADGNAVAAFTDLLLHDMGPGLDDGVGEPGVASAEWRTAPLIALQEGDGRRYLHDGRAGSLDAALRAHGGEAEAARDRYVALSDEERSALVAFVEAL
jgi:CxxC motif-containing protein (DUF1111 family)